MLFFFSQKKNISDKRLMSFSMNYVKKQHIFVVLTSTAQMHNAITIFNSNAHRHFLSMINDNNLSWIAIISVRIAEFEHLCIVLCLRMRGIFFTKMLCATYFESGKHQSKKELISIWINLVQTFFTY